MKNRVKLNEAQLRQIVAESVKKVLNESTLYGDTKPFEEIYRAANQIMDRFQYTQEDDYVDMSDDGAALDYQVYQWAKKVSEDAEYYISCNSSNQSINGGEDM